MRSVIPSRSRVPDMSRVNQQKIEDSSGQIEHGKRPTYPNDLMLGVSSGSSASDKAQNQPFFFFSGSGAARDG